MTADWKRVEELFGEALERPPGERAAWLEGACDDAAVRAEVLSLLAYSSGGGARLSEAMAVTAEAIVEDLAAAPLGGRIGPYRLLRVLGEGGMGTVYLAERDDGQYRGQVALKVLQHAAASQQVVARFRDERQILATLKHPSIVKLLDGGTTDDGLPYLVMEHIEGEPLDRYARRLSVRERVALMLRVCEPLEHAHQRLVVHRDMKPSNVLVTPDGRPMLLDFGIAKLIEPSAAAGREARTRTGVALLTPEYASPEQARGEIVSVASDVYALGAVLYHLLAGRPPQTPTDDVLATLRQICELDPPRPSTLAPAHERAAVAGDLDSITLRALQKDPARRYPSVAAFAEDLARHLTGRPVAAREATLGYRAARFVRRHRGALALATLVVGALSAATVVSIVEAGRASQAAELASAKARALTIEQGRQQLAAGRPGRALPYFLDAWQGGEDTTALRLLVREAARPLEAELATVRDFPAGLTTVTLAPDGDAFLACGHDGHAALYDLDGRRERDLSAPPPPGVGRTLACAFDRRGERVVAVAREGPAFAWRRADGALLWQADLGAAPMTDQWSNLVGGLVVGDTHLIVCRRQATADLVDLTTGATRLSLPFVRATGVSCTMTRDGRRLFVGEDPVLQERDGTTGAVVRTLPVPEGEGGYFTAPLLLGPDERRLYYPRYIHDLTSNQTVAYLPHPGGARNLGLSRDARRLVTTSGLGTVRLWDAVTGALDKELPSPSDGGPVAIEHADFDAAGRRLVTTASDNFLRVFDVASGGLELAHEVVPSAGSSAGAPAVALRSSFTPDGRVVSQLGAHALVWRPDRAELRQDLTTEFLVYAGAVSPDRTRVALVGENTAHVRRLVGGDVLARLEVDRALRYWSASWSVHDRVAIGGEAGYVALFDPRRGAPSARLVGHVGTVNGVAFSRDGQALATGGEDGIRIWDVARGVERAHLAPGSRVMSLAWSGDGASLVAAAFAGVLTVWDVASERATTRVEEPGLRFLSVRFTADERGLIGGARESTAAIWDRATGARRLTLEGHTAQVTWADDDDDGHLVATASVDMTVRLWDAATGLELGQRRHFTEILEGEWAGDAVVSYGNGAAARVWDAGILRGGVEEAAATLLPRVPWRLVGGHLERRR